MSSYQIQFTLEDMLPVLESWQHKCAKDERTRSFFICSQHHDFNGYVDRLLCLENIIKQPKKTISFRDDVFKSILQRAYSHNIINILSVNPASANN